MTQPVIFSHVWRAIASVGNLNRNNSFVRIFNADTNTIIVPEIRLNDLNVLDTRYQTFESDDLASLLEGVSIIRVEIYLKTRGQTMKTNYFDDVSLSFTELPDEES